LEEEQPRKCYNKSYIVDIQIIIISPPIPPSGIRGCYSRRVLQKAVSVVLFISSEKLTAEFSANFFFWVRKLGRQIEDLQKFWEKEYKKS